jgi:hypothetical protein
MLSETQLSTRIELFLQRKTVQYPELRVPTTKFRQARMVRLTADNQCLCGV